MNKTLFLITAVVALLTPDFSVGATLANKCVINGKTSYQQEACPSGQVRRPPTVQELNAEQQKRRAASAEPTGKASPALPIVPSSFRCDGRKYCSQMTSCAEAKYFLASCPDAKVDGDRNGIPCEKQWCRF